MGLVAVVAAWVALGPLSCAGTPACERNSDCLAAYCAEGVCKQDCVDAALDCPKGYVCNAIAQCEYGGIPGPSGAGGGAGVTTTSGAGGAGATTTTSAGGGASTATTGAGGGAGGTKTTLDPCGDDAACVEGLVCRSLTVGGSKRCTPLCATTSECWSGARCEAIGGTSYCAGLDVGRSCATAGTCNFACLLGPGYCTTTCASGADCPNGYGCAGVGSPAIDVCIKAEAPCGPGDTAACIGASACDTGINLVVPGCTLPCGTASDCPKRAAGLPAWTCDGLCRRPADVHGPLEGGYAPAQYACDIQGNVVNVCNDGQHIDFDAFSIPPAPQVSCGGAFTTDGQPGDACVDSCRYQGGCAHGFGCTAVGGVGASRIGLCLPTGGAEVGTACSSDTQCVFGYCSGGACSRDCSDDGVCPTGSTCQPGGAPTVEGKTFMRCE